MDLMDDIREHEAWNEEMAKRHDPDAFLTKTSLPVRWIGSLRLSAATRLLAPGPSSRLLDVGCGPGNLLERLRGAELVGVDLSETLLAQARTRLAGRPEVKLVKAPAEALPYPDGYFDRAVCSEVLEHVMDPKVVLKEIRRVCKAGAIVVLTYPNETLINATKRVIIALGLKDWVAGGYQMSDDMLHEWHKTEIEPDWILKEVRGLFEPIERVEVPSRFLSYHSLLSFRAV